MNHLLLSALVWVGIPLLLQAAEPKQAPPASNLQQIFYSLELERQGNYEAAEKAWLQVFPQSETVQNHLFALRLAQGQRVTPKNMVQIEITAEYLLWKNNPKDLNTFFSKTKGMRVVALARVQYLLNQGQWNQASEALKKFKAKTRGQQEMADLLQLRLYLLQGKNLAAREHWKKINREHLYLDPGELDLRTGKFDLSQLEQALLLQPQDTSLRQALIEQYYQRGQVAKAWALQGHRADQWQAVIKGLKGASPQELSHWGQHWLKKKNAPALQALGEIFEENYPQYIDGSFYQQQAKDLAQ